MQLRGRPFSPSPPHHRHPRAKTRGSTTPVGNPRALAASQDPGRCRSNALLPSGTPATCPWVCRNCPGCLRRLSRLPKRLHLVQPLPVQFPPSLPTGHIMKPDSIVYTDCWKGYDVLVCQTSITCGSTIQSCLPMAGTTSTGSRISGIRPSGICTASMAFQRRISACF